MLLTSVLLHFREVDEHRTFVVASCIATHLDCTLKPEYSYNGEPLDCRVNGCTGRRRQTNPKTQRRQTSVPEYHHQQAVAGQTSEPLDMIISMLQHTMYTEYRVRRRHWGSSCLYAEYDACACAEHAGACVRCAHKVAHVGWSSCACVGHDREWGVKQPV